WAAGEVTEVGGDFYDVFQIAEQRWAIVVGDVCGTGPSAAAVTAIARHTIRAAATHGATATQVLDWVNEAIRASGGGLFCTVLYATLALLDEGTWSFTSVAGGHPLPILVEPAAAGGDAAAQMLGAHGTLIGVLPTIQVEATSTVLRSGATVVIHTDGVNDVRPPHELDDAQLRTMVAEAASAPGTADVVAERLGAAITAILPIPERGDDVAVVVLRID
ncbi:MAG: histidine kinase, partial [Ilumatobacteraceae bacterium]|nr:histidine kinase [Ilumatobacteraceae bacterium]